MPEIVVLCPQCGSQETVDQNQEYVKCHHCFTTFPLKESKTVLDSALRRQIDDAITKRNNCDFNEATLILEDLVAANPNVAEICFQLLLTDYGVSYVSDDGSSIREKPVISGVQKESIYNKEYYHKLETILSEYPNTLKNYKERLDEIEKLRIESLKMMEKIEPFDVFICYKRTADGGLYTPDSFTARKLYTKFTEWGLKTFFAEETIYKQYGGQTFEPIIASALMSAKLMVVVCATPERSRDFLLAPWVKNEWLRFKKRVENEVDVKLALLPIFDNGFKPENLPRALNGFQGIKLDDEFDKNIAGIINQVISREKKSKFNEIKVEANKVGTLSVKREEINVRQFAGFKEKELSNLEKTDFTMAVADMKINSNAKYKAAYKKLARITETNKYNFEANLAKLKCNFKIPNDESLVNTSLWRVDDINRMNNDFLSLMEAGGDDCVRVRKAMVQMLKKSLADNPSKFANELKKEESTFLNVAKTFTDRGELFDYAKEFEKPYFDLINNRAQNPKLRDDEILNIANKLFRRIYSNYEEKGAKQIFDLYLKSFKTLSVGNKKENKNLVDQFINLALEINKLDVDCLWYRFTFDMDCLGAAAATPFVLSSKLKKNNFIEFKINAKRVDDKEKEANLYYFIIKAIESGYKMNFSDNDNYFNIILKTACIMVNKKKNKEITKKIFNLFASLTGSGSTSDANTIKLLMTIGNRLLIEKQYKEAKRYFEEVLTFDDSNSDARWGITKCEIKKPTNYSVLFYRKSLNDVPAFRMLIAVHEERHPDQVDHYLAFYQAIENIKNSRGKNKRLIYKAFKNRHNVLMKRDLPYDTPVEDIIVAIGNGTLVQEAQQKKAPKTSSKTPNVSHYSFAKERWSLFFNILFIIAAVAAVILLKPESAFLMIFALAIIAAIMSRSGFGHLATGRSPYKPLLIVLSILSFVPYIVIFYTIVLADQQILNVFNNSSNQYGTLLAFSTAGFALAFIYFLSTIIRKTKPSSSDLDNSNAFAYYLLKIMAVSGASIAGFFMALSIANTGTLFGAELDMNNGLINWFVSYVADTMSTLMAVLTIAVLRIIRGSGS